MDKNIGYAVITTEEYKEMIEDIINKKECIKELNRVDGEEKEIYKKLEQYFWNKIIENESYHLENMKQCNPADYHYQQLYNCFLEIGIDNVTYIHLSISSLKHNFDNKENKEEDIKRMKGYELIKEITEGKIKDNTQIEVHDLSVLDKWITNIEYKNRRLNWEEGTFDTSYLLNPNCYFRVIEDQEEIDIQEIEDIKDVFIENSTCGEDVKYLARKYNEILKWAKQLDKKIKEKE